MQYISQVCHMHGHYTVTIQLQAVTTSVQNNDYNTYMWAQGEICIFLGHDTL